MPTVNLGIIGYGGFGPFLHQAWALIDDVTVSAVADADPTRRPEGVPFFTSWHPLITEPDIDLIVVATPPGTHAEIACAAMEAGKHVLVEKPLATTLDDAHRIRSVRDRTGRIATVDFMLRFNPIVETLHAWCRNGSFGQLRRVVVENYAQDETLLPEHWFWNPSVSGGILVEHAVHFIDIVQSCTSAPVQRIDGLSVRRNRTQTDRMMATVLYEDGLVATQFHAFTRPGFFERTSMRFVFDLAQVDIEGWIPLSGRIMALARTETRPELARLPGFQSVHETDLRNEAFASRSVLSGGVAYEVEFQLEGTFAVSSSKSATYAACLQGLMKDLVTAIHDPSHSMRVTLEDGLASLDIALRATRHALG